MLKVECGFVMNSGGKKRSQTKKCWNEKNDEKN